VNHVFEETETQQKNLIGFHIMSKTIEISHLSREEKLRAMESVWEDLSREDEQVKLPDRSKTSLFAQIKGLFLA